MAGTNDRDGVTELLDRWNQGDVAARDALMPLVYDELRRVARRKLAGQHSDHTLQATALVHEAYMRLVNRKQAQWQDRTHFFALAAQMMRQILVDHARSHNAAKRGGGAISVTLDEESGGSAGTRHLLDSSIVDLIDLDTALNKLAELDTSLSLLVDLRFFGGLSI